MPNILSGEALNTNRGDGKTTVIRNLPESYFFQNSTKKVKEL